ncbi:LAMI_0A07360g1_1 [Lachancea mirantina]|uniref:LAMI_0A07360g1_1 n=1 Tax=Lachancea mirantina TaxID=1230905 RepID=A0A1G4IQV5_9SACH|nr:LAMI_0A07360g1_1 [Lachancea mirantina]
MGLIKKVLNWSQDGLYDYISVNPTREEVAHYKVDPENESDDSIIKLKTVKNFENITCLDYSDVDPGFVGVGEKNGTIGLFNIMQDAAATGDSGSHLKVRAKQQRAVNSIGISTNGLIAAGFERNKYDPSLQIWDVSYQSTSSNVINPAFSYCSNETIVSVSFLDETTIIAGSTKLLREIDLRSPTPVFQHPTRLCYDVKINPFNLWEFATYADDGTLAIWDRRRLVSDGGSREFLEAQPLLKFDKLMGNGAASRKYTNSCFRWSALQNGEFSTLHSGQLVRRWRLGRVPEVPIADTDHSQEQNNTLFVSTVRDINTTFDRVATFDYVPRLEGVTSYICMRQSGTLFRMSLDEGVSISKFNCGNDLLISVGDQPGLEEFNVGHANEVVESDALLTTAKNLSIDDMDNSSEIAYLESTESENLSTSHQALDNDTSDVQVESSVVLKPEQLLDNDISMLMRRRALLSYGLDPMGTVELIDKLKSLQNNSYIRNTWRWLSIAKASVDDGTMVSGELDLGYEGILGIWNGLDGLSKQDRYQKDTILTEKQLDRELEKIIRLRGRSKSQQGLTSKMRVLLESKKPTQRKLCMIISGWDLTPADYEEKYQKLIKLGQYEKAAGWAVFFGDVTKAIDILASAKKERLRLIATAIAGYAAYKNQPGNNAWRDQCRRMSSDLEDPYLRVIFGFIADNDWWDILYEPAISLRERLGVALRFLNDRDLTRFLERTSASVIEKGELEGLILTGITPSGIELLHSYVNKTSDVQTAALISIFGCPRYFRDERVDEWVQSYRDMLNAWELFSARAKFDVLRAKLSRTNRNESTVEVRPRQLYLQCLTCNKNVNKPIIDNGATKVKGFSNAKKFGFTGNSNSSQPRQRYSCPHCGTPFPRCSICLLPMGTSDLPILISGRTTSKEDAEEETVERKRLSMNEWFSFCLTCNHGMHAGHAEEWFEKHLICPVPGCACSCNR